MATETNHLSIRRLARLSDLIFAVAMTVMALTFETIPPEDLNAQQVTELLQTQLPSLGTYALTFIVIAFYWVSHLHQFKHYQRTDTVHLWLTLLSLLFVVLMPYANALSDGYETVLAVQFFYSLVTAGIGVFSTAAWIYATQNRRLVSEHLTEHTIRRVRRESYVEPLVALLAIVGGLIHPWGWTATFLLLPVLLAVQSKGDDQ